MKLTKNDYLWDGSGHQDPEMQKLEHALAQFRLKQDTFVFPAINSAKRDRSLAAILAAGWIPRFSAATLLLSGFVICVLLLRSSPIIGPIESRVSGPAWEVASLTGTPRIGQFFVQMNSGKAQLSAGQVLITDTNSAASVGLAEIGEFSVDPDSRVRLVESAPGRERLALELGTIHAAIWAPPGQFVVDTPAATAVDLGCAYTLQVNQDGSGMLRTTLGWVGFHKDGHDSFIPAGAMSITHVEQGPGTPYFEDASEKLRDALYAFDFESLSAQQRAEALRIIIKHARVRDAFTLWHLLFRVTDDERPLVYDRLSSLVAPPSGVTRQGTLALNSQMMDSWWNAFDFGDISIWRYWEQNQAPAAFKKASR